MEVTEEKVEQTEENVLQILMPGYGTKPRLVPMKYEGIKLRWAIQYPSGEFYGQKWEKVGDGLHPVKVFRSWGLKKDAVAALTLLWQGKPVPE